MAERAPPPSYDEAMKVPKPGPGTVPKPGPGTVPKPGPGPQPTSDAPVQVIFGTFSPFPQRMICPSCHSEVDTRVKYRPNTNTHLIALLLCFLFWPCALYPYCIDTCQDAMHYCPSCGTYLGTYTN